MHPAIRTQVDGLGEEYSELTALHFDPEKDPDMTRQEFAADADINNILRKAGATGMFPGQRPTQYGEIDFGMDLQQAIGAIEAARRMHSRLPENLVDKYPTWQSVLNGLNDGTLRLDMEQDAREETGTTTTRTPLATATGGSGQQESNSETEK